MSVHPISDAELMLAPDGSIYHLRMFPEQLTDTVLLVGDPARVDLVLEHLTRGEILASNREFRSARGYAGKLPVSVVSTGIGAGCIDIVLNELDALANLNFESRTPYTTPRSLDWIRIGTAGALQADTPTGTTLITAMALAFDDLAYFYKRLPDVEDLLCKSQFREFVQASTLEVLPTPYCVASDSTLLKKMAPLGEQGITFSMPGFYAPQGRQLRLEPQVANFAQIAQRFTYNGLRALNMEMESGALNGLAAMLGHRSVTLCTAINNRSKGQAKTDYLAMMHNLLEKVVDRLRG